MTKAVEEASTGVGWKDPPPRSNYHWDKIAAKLKRRPMTWYLVFKADFTHKVNAINEGKVPAVHPDLGFETRTANNKRETPRTCDLYMRFNPDKVNPLREAVQTTKQPKKNQEEG